MTGIHQTIFKTIFIGVVAVIFAGAGLYFSSCNSNVGLGEAVDTEAPTVSIEYPPANAIVRDAFILAGECSDDKNVAKVEIMISGTLVTNSPVTLNEDGTWEVKVNNKGAGSYPLKDGKYIFNAIAYDDVGRKSAVAERAIEIDNTEPVFIIKTPGGIDIKNPTSYGSMFKVSGNIADDHDIKTFDVDVYDEANSKLEVKLHEENISVAGGTEITFAQYNGEDELNARYIGMYGEGTSGDKSFYCTVKIADSAGKYTKPKKNGDGGGWNTEPDTDSEGNVTTKVYLYDEVYTEYMGKNSVYKFTANDFKAILNGSYQVVDAAKASNDGNRAASITSQDLEDLQKKLSDILKDTSSEKQRLTFKLNKDANPHYEFSGYALDKKDNKYTFSENSASKGSKITFTAKMGLDETYIDPKTITVYCFGPYESDADAETIKIYSNPKDYYENKSVATDKKRILFDGSKEYEGPTKDSFTTTFTMGDILDGKKYILAASGKDQDDLELVESVEYGFEGVASGQPPRIQITKPTASSNAVIALNGDMTISGTATTAVSEITEIRYEISVYDEGNGNNELTKDDKGNSASIKGTTTFTKTTEGCNWSFDIKEKIKGLKYEAKDGNNYKYMITVIAKNSLGLEGQADTTLAVDAKAPEINNITVTPIAKNKEGNNPDVVNGRIKVSFSIADSYLAGTTLVLEQEGKTKKETKYEGSRTLIEEYIYTAKDWDDKKDLKFTVTATDKANNSTTKDYTCRIDQSTDDPVVTITGAKDSDSVKSASEIAEGKNLFGVSSRNLSGSVSDDDGIGEAYISVYEGEGVTGKTPLKDHNKKPIQGTLSHMLPEKEGVYTVVIEAKDKRETNPKDDTPTKSITKTYYVAVDSGAPTITDVSPRSGEYFAEIVNVKGTVNDGSGIKSISVKTGIKEGNDIKWDEETGTKYGESDKFDKNGPKPEANFKPDVKYEIDDKIKLPGDARGIYAVKYIATDIYGQKTEYPITYNIDKADPWFKITSIDDKPSSLSGGGLAQETPIKLSVSGFLKLEGEVYDDVNFGDYCYYKLTETKPNYENSSAPDYEDPSDWTREKISRDNANDLNEPNANDKGKWNLKIPLNAYDAGNTYSLYITFIDVSGRISKSDANPSGIVRVIPDDITKPTVNITTVLPSIGSEQVLNGVVNASVVLSDETALSDNCYWHIRDGNVNTTCLGEEDDSKKTLIPVVNDEERYSMNKSLEIDTTKITETSGTYTLCVHAIDKAKNSKTASKVLNIDQSTDIPTITFNKSDGDKFGIEGNSIQVTVKDDDEIGKVTYKLDGAATSTSLFTRTEGQKKTDDTYTITLSNDISTGEHTLSVTVEDYVNEEGRTAKTKDLDLTFIYDKDTPDITIEPLESQFQKQSFTIKGTASDASGIEKIVGTLEKNNVKVNYSTSEIHTEDDKWNVDVTIPTLDETATYKWTFTATDKYGRTGIATVTHKVDVTAPVLTDSGADKIAFKAGTHTVYSDTVNTAWFKEGQNSITISGNLDEANPDKIIMTIKGKDSTGNERNEEIEYATASKKYSINSDYYDGKNEVTLQAFDKAGHPSVKKTFTLQVDTEKPAIEKLQANPNGLIKDSDVVITATVKDVLSGVKSVELYCNGETTRIASELLDDNVYKFTITKTAYSEFYSTGTHTLEVRATDNAGNFSSDKLTVSVDTTEPTIEINSILPKTVSAKDNKEYLNGVVTVSAKLQDETELSEDRCYWYVTKKDDANKISDIISEGVVDNTIEISSDNKLYKNLSISLNTTKISGEYTTDGTGKGDYTLHIYAVDKAGNHFEATEELNIDQSTDLPTLNINDVDASVSASAISEGKNLFNKGKTLNGSASDDDGVKEITYSLYKGKDTTGTLYNNNPVTSTSSTISYSLPSEEGYYTLVVTVADTNGDTGNPIPQRTITKTYHIAVDAGAPTITDVTPANGNYFSQANKMIVIGTVKDGNGIKTDENGIAKIKRENKKKDGTIIDTTYVTVGSDEKFTDTVTPLATNGDYEVVYTATDIFGQSTTHTITYKVDSVSPSFTINKINEEPNVNLNVSSPTYPDTMFLNKKDGVLEVSGTVKDEVSGFDGFAYYALAASVPDYNKLSDISVWKKTAITTTDNKNGKWELSIPVKTDNYVSGTEYFFYITFKDGAGNISKANVDDTKPNGMVKVIPDGKDPTIGTPSATPSELVSKNKDDDVIITVSVTDAEDGVAPDAVSKVKSVALYLNGTNTNIVPSNTSDNYTFTINKGSTLHNTSKVHNLEVRATDNAGNEALKTFEFSVDTQLPEVTGVSVSPIVSKDNKKYLNGVVTVSATLRDETALADGTYNDRNCYLYVKNASDEKVKGISVTYSDDGLVNADINGDIKIPISSDEKLYKAIKFDLDTTQISGEYDKDDETKGKGEYTLYICAVDKAGNFIEAKEFLNIDQSTDLPTLKINEVDENVPVEGITSGKNLFTPGKTLNVSASDDDGLGAITYSLYKGKKAEGTPEPNNETVVNSTIGLPDAEGYYTLVVTVADINTSPKTTKKIYYIGLDSGSPTFETVLPASGNYYSASRPMEVTGTLKDGNGIKTLKRRNLKADGTEISSDASAEVSISITDKGNGTFEFTDTVTPSSTNDSYKVEYTATDNFEQPNKYTITYKVDSAAPTFTITHIGGEELSTALKGGSETYATTVYLKESDGSLEVSGTVKDGVSGFDGFAYYALATTAPDYEKTSDSNVWKKSAISTSDNNDGTWELSIPVKGYESGISYYLYMTFKDGAGNISEPISGKEKIITVIPDAVAPTIENLEADPKGITSNNIHNDVYDDITITATVTDAVSDVASVVLLYEGNTGIALTKNASGIYEVTIKETKHPNLYTSGVHALEVRATDNAGNISSKTISISVDTQAPQIDINSISPRVADEDGTEWLNGTVIVSATLTDDIAFRGDEEDDTGKCYWYVTKENENNKISIGGENDIKIDIGKTEKLYKNLSIKLDTTQISGENATDTTGNGKYTLHIYAEDKAGNKYTEIAELNIDQSTDKPTVSFNKADGDKLGIEGNTIQVTVKDDDEIGSVKYELDNVELNGTAFTRTEGQKKTDVSKPITLPNNITTGTHKLTVTVVDYVAETDRTPKTEKFDLNFVYDNDNPVITITQPSEFQQKTFKIEGTASDEAGISTVVGTLKKNGVAVEDVSVDANTTLVENSTTNYTWTATATIPGSDSEIDDSAIYEWTFTATDNNGRTGKNSATHKVDVKKPEFIDEANGTDNDKKITFKAGTRTVYSDTVNTAWFKEGQNSITISGKLTEANPEHVTMKITGKNETGGVRGGEAGFETVNYTTAAQNYSINSTYYDGTNQVVLKAVDKAGNESGTKEFTLKVDTQAPTLDESTITVIDKNGNAIVNTVNTDELKLSYTATDSHATIANSSDVSGIARIQIASKYAFDENSILYDSDKDATRAFTVGAQTVEVSAQTISIDALSEGANTLYIKVIDVAGNEYEEDLVTFTYDVTPATVSIATPAAGAEVNKTISITGSVSDKIGLPVTPNTPTGQLQIKKENGTWEDALPGSVVSPVTFENNNTSWSCEFDTTAYNATGTDKTVSIRMIIPDNAGNINDADEGRQITINQDSDRPKIVLTNMDITGTKLKQSTTVYGSISDDDSDSTGVVKGLYIIEKKKFETGKYPSATELNGWTKLSVQAGSGSFSHEGDGEGTLEFYFYCIDNENTPFYWEKTNALDRMYIAGMTKVDGVYDYKDETSGISYTADMNAPVVSLKVARGDAYENDKDYSAGSKVFSKNGKYSELYIEMTVTEAVEMAKDSDGKFITPIVNLNDIKVDEGKLGNITINGANIATFRDTTKPEDGKYVYKIGPINLDTDAYKTDEDINTWRLTAEVSDASDQKGVGNMNITMDTTAPQILITSPSPSISDAVMAAITIKGLAQDDASSIKDLRWAIPLRSTETSTYNYTVDNDGLFTSIGISSAWEIKFSSGSTDSPDSLLYYANAALYAVKETVAGSGIYEVPIYFYVEDAVGNKAVQTKNTDGKDLMVYVDADGGKPKAWINSPEQNAKVTGVITIYGGASDNISVDRVEIQVDVDGDDDFDADDYKSIKETGTLGAEIKTTAAQKTDGSDWWIPAIGTNSWKVTIDTSNIDTGKKIKIRCRAWDNESTPLTRGWDAGEVVKVEIDSNAPVIKDVKLVQFGDGVEPIIKNGDVLETNPNAKTVSELEYTAGMYISNVSVDDNGEWYLTATVTDNSKVESIIAEDANVTTSTRIVSLEKDVLGKCATGTDEEKKIFIPIKTSNSGMVYSTLTAKDNSTPAGSAIKEIRINIDSTPPSLFKTDNMQSSTADGDLRLKPSNSPNMIGDRGVQNREQVANSNGLFTFGDYIQEADSGLAFLAFYFDRSGTIYDPMNKYDLENNKWFASYGTTATDKAVYKNTDNLPALYLTGVERTEDSLTISGVSEANKGFIRKGGLVKIGGSYRLITKVEGDKVSFTPTCSESFTTAEIIFAQIVDHQISESVGADGKVDKNYDDGDGMIESVNHIGSSYIWSASIDSSNIADGPITIGVAAIDNAGNIATGSINTFVSNNRPRIAKVLIGTDLNSDGRIDFNATSSLNTEEDKEAPAINGAAFGEFSYYSTQSQSGKAQTSATIIPTTTENGGKTFKTFKVRDGLCIIPEFVGGNGTEMFYTWTDGVQEQATKGDGSSLFSMTPRDDLLLETRSGLKLRTLGNSPIKNEVGKFGGIILESENAICADHSGVNVLSITFWDSTDEMTPGQDSLWALLNVELDFSTVDTIPPESRIEPFWWKSKDDSSLMYKTEEGTKYLEGHIELESDLPNTFDASAGVNDRDPKVSGTIKVTGTVSDDWLLKEVGFSFNSGSGGNVGQNVKTLAKYVGGIWTNESLPTGVSSFSISDISLSQDGHSACFTLILDTQSLLPSGAQVGEDLSLAIYATDAKGDNNNGNKNWNNSNNNYNLSSNLDDSDLKKGLYKMDVVPYVCEIVTSLTSFGGDTHSLFSRTAQGHYPVRVGSSFMLKGYNLGSNPTITLAENDNYLSDAIPGASYLTDLALSRTVASTAKSGEISVIVNGIPALNNRNSNKARGSAISSADIGHYYNMQPNGVNNDTLSDDLFIDVWEFKNAAEPVNGAAKDVTMKINPKDSTPGFSFANSILYFNMPGYEQDTPTEAESYHFVTRPKVFGENYSQIPVGMNYGGFTGGSFCYDNYGYSYGASMCTDTQSAYASAFFQFFSRESPIKAQWMNQNMNYVNSANASRLDSSTVQVRPDDTTGWVTDINRIQSVSMEATTNVSNVLTDATPTYVFMAYYDVSTKQVRFRWGTVGNETDSIDGQTTRAYATTSEIDTGDARKGAHNKYNPQYRKDELQYAYGLDDVVDSKYTGVAQGYKSDGETRPSKIKDSFVQYSGTKNNGVPIQIVAASGVSGGKSEYATATPHCAGQYVSLSIVNKDKENPIAVVSWYDSVNRKLCMAYNENPTTGNTWITTVIDNNGGINVKTAVDGEGGIHFAYYDNMNGSDLKYAYMSSFDAGTAEIATIDAYGAVGAKPTIDVAKDGDNWVPYIGYQMNSYLGTPVAAKMARRVKFGSGEFNGVSGDKYTGNWEVSVIPTDNIPNDDLINIGVYKEGGELKEFKTGNDIKPNGFVANGTLNVCNPTKLYGNGTANPIIGYGIDTGAIEMAQKK